MDSLEKLDVSILSWVRFFKGPEELQDQQKRLCSRSRKPLFKLERRRN